MTEFHFTRQFDGFGRNLELRVVDKDNHAIAREITMEIVSQGVVVPVAAIIHPDAAAQMMDDLWRLGIRPTSGTGDYGHVESLKNHLCDMRTIAFHSLSIPTSKEIR
jgi:hypothetical protein